jgi:hypothetical protein
MKAGQWRWCQVVRVIRDDEKAEYIKDFGPAELFETVTPMMMPSFGENTVAELQDYADKNRVDTYWQTRAKQIQSESTLIKDHIEQYEKIQAIIRNRTVSGPKGTTQRNGWDQTRTQRRARELKERVTGRVFIR